MSVRGRGIRYGAKQSSSEAQILVGGWVTRPRGTAALSSEFVGEMTTLEHSQEEGDIGLTAEWPTGQNTEHGLNSGESLFRADHVAWTKVGRRRWTWLALGTKSDFKGRRDNVFVSIESELYDKKESRESVTWKVNTWPTPSGQDGGPVPPPPPTRSAGGHCLARRATPQGCALLDSLQSMATYSAYKGTAFQPLFE